MSRTTVLRAAAGTLALAAASAGALAALRLALEGAPLRAAGAAALGMLLAAAFGVQARRPAESAAGLQQVVTVAFVVAGASSLTADRRFALLALGLAAIAAALLLLHPRGGIAVTLPDTPSGTMVGLALASAVVFLPHAALAAGGHDGEPVSTALAAASAGVPLVALLAALRARGWRVSAWSSGAAGALLASVSLVYPDEDGSLARGWITPSLPLTRGWAAAALLWALLFVAYAEWRCRVTRDI